MLYFFYIVVIFIYVVNSKKIVQRLDLHDDLKYRPNVEIEQFFKTHNIKILHKLENSSFLVSVEDENIHDRKLSFRDLKLQKHKFKFKYDIVGYHGLILVYTVWETHEFLSYLKSKVGFKGLYMIKDGFDENVILLRITHPKFLNETLYYIADCDGVLWFDIHRRHYKNDAFASSVITSEPLNSQTLYTVKNDIVTVTDTGLDLLHCVFQPSNKVIKKTLTLTNGKTLSQELKFRNEYLTSEEKVIAYFSINFDDGVESHVTDFKDREGGHGTHVANLAAGDDSKCDITYHSPKSLAKIIFFDIENTNSDESHGLVIPPLITPMMKISYEMGSRVFTNSWGSATCEYTVYAMEMDRFSYFYEDYIILVAAGNAGPEPYTLGAPASLKNGIAIGSSQNSIESFFHYMNHSEYWEGGKVLFTSDELHSKSYGKTNLADFSSRGPACDGRIKPDVVCPGEYILSAKALGMWLLMRGTSMATPLCAKKVTVLREVVPLLYNIVSPSSSLIKNILITTAKHLDGSAQKLALYQSHIVSKKVKNDLNVYDEGFGRVDLSDVLEGDKIQMKDRQKIISYQEPLKRCYVVAETGVISYGLVWTDVPAFVMSSKTLVNDLNLKIIINNNTIIYGNHGSFPDKLNNVERVRVLVTENDTLEVYISSVGNLVTLKPKLFQTYSIVYSSLLKEIECSYGCNQNSPPNYCITSNNREGVRLCTETGWSNDCYEICNSDPYLIVNNNTCQCHANKPCEENGFSGHITCVNNSYKDRKCEKEHNILKYYRFSNFTKRGLSKFIRNLQVSTADGIDIYLWLMMVACAFLINFLFIFIY